MSVWEAEEKFKIHLPGWEEKEVEGEITVEKVKQVAREMGLKKFIVEDSEGNALSPSDFPVKKDIYIKEYDSAK